MMGQPNMVPTLPHTRWIPPSCSSFTERSASANSSSWVLFMFFFA